MVTLSTHVLEVVEKLCDRFLILKSGQLVSDMTSGQLRKLKNEKKGIDLESHLINLINTVG